MLLPALSAPKTATVMGFKPVVIMTNRREDETRLRSSIRAQLYRARQIIAALNENIALDTDVQAWATNTLSDFQALVKQSRLTDEEQQATVQGFQRSVADSPLWPALRAFLATDIELDELSIQFYQDIGKGNTARANSYVDRIQALGKKDTELASQVSRASQGDSSFGTQSARARKGL